MCVIEFSEVLLEQKDFIVKKPNVIIALSDDEYEQGMELSGCDDSKKVADGVYSHFFFDFAT